MATAVTQRIRGFFDVENMIKPEQRRGPLPPSKEMYRKFMEIAWPSALESVLVGLVGAVDTMMVGNLGDAAIAAVGITNQPKFILLCIIFSLNVGVTAVVARRKGQKDQAGAVHAMRNGLLLSCIIALTMSVLGYIFAEPFMKVAGAQEEYLADAVAYFRILVVSIFFQALNLTINAAQKGCGNTRISMYTNVVSNIVNIIFNYFLINGACGFPRLEVRGAAIATCLGSFVACMISLAKLLPKDTYLSVFYPAGWRLSKKVLQPVFKVSGSALVEQLCLRVGFLLYAVIVAKLGTTSYATHIICMNILSISFSFGDGFAVASSALVGQNLGAGRPDKSILFGRVGQRIVLMVSCCLCILFFFGRHFLVGLYSDSPEVIALGGNIMLMIAVITYFQTSQVVCAGALRGAGDTMYVAAVSLIATAIIRPLLSWVLCYPMGWGLYGAWVGVLVDQGLRLVFNYGRFKSGKWMKIVL